MGLKSQPRIPPSVQHFKAKGTGYMETVNASVADGVGTTLAVQSFGGGNDELENAHASMNWRDSIKFLEWLAATYGYKLTKIKN